MEPVFVVVDKADEWRIHNERYNGICKQRRI